MKHLQQYSMQQCPRCSRQVMGNSSQLQWSSGATVKRYLFNSRTHKLSKSISAYLTELKKLVKYYRFKETLKPMLRDHLVCGTSNNHWLYYLFGEEYLTRMQ